jgi:hypothetical protein
MIFDNYEPSEFRMLAHEVVNSSDTNIVSPRGLKTYEITPGIIIMPKELQRKRVHWHKSRFENSIFGYIEGIQVLAGQDFVHNFGWYAPKIAQFADEGTTFFHGSYGPRLGTHKWSSVEELIKTRRENSKFTDNIIGLENKPDGWRNFCVLNQFTEVFKKLIEDPSSRQAVMTIWNPSVDNDPHKDIPCTVAFQFLVRNKLVHMNTYMRSQDLMTGFLYDTMQFRLFQEIMAGWLGLDVGDYHHFVGSLHIYEKDIEKTQTIFTNTDYRDIYQHYKTFDARLPYNQWVYMMEILTHIENFSRQGLISRSMRFLKKLENINQFWLDLAKAIISINAGKYGNIGIAKVLAEGIKSDLQVPTLARAFAYHKRKTGENITKDYGHIYPIEWFLDSIDSFVEEKGDSIKLAKELEHIGK